MSNATVNDSKYKAEFKAGTFQMSEEQYVSLRRSEDGLEEFIPTKAPQDPDFQPTADDARYVVEFESGNYAMNLQQYVELRRAEDGKAAFIS